MRKVFRFPSSSQLQPPFLSETMDASNLRKVKSNWDLRQTFREEDSKKLRSYLTRVVATKVLQDLGEEYNDFRLSEGIRVVFEGNTTEMRQRKRQRKRQSENLLAQQFVRDSKGYSSTIKESEEEALKRCFSYDSGRQKGITMNHNGQEVRLYNNNLRCK